MSTFTLSDDALGGYCDTPSKQVFEAAQKQFVEGPVLCLMFDASEQHIQHFTNASARDVISLCSQLINALSHKMIEDSQ